MQNFQDHALQESRDFHRYEPNEEFLQVLEKLDKEAEAQNEYDRRQLEAVFQQS